MGFTAFLQTRPIASYSSSRTDFSPGCHKQIVEEMLADGKTLLAEHLLKKAS